MKGVCVWGGGVGCAEAGAMAELSFRTYGMICSFVTIGILMWFQWQIGDIFSGSGFVWTVLGLSAGGLLFVIECLDFWRYVAALRVSAQLCH